MTSLRATVWIGAGMDAGPHALALLKGSEGAEAIIAHALSRSDPGAGSRPAQAEADANDWRKLLLLTARQMAIVKGFTKGMTNQEIADETGIGFDTVKSHIAIALKKTGAPDRARLAYLYAKLEEAHRLGLVPSAAIQGRSTGVMFAGEREVARRRRERRLQSQSEIPAQDAADDDAEPVANN
jgi:DNA-binding CsgD family transcriptional regulator